MNATSWQNSWKKLPSEIKKEAGKYIGSMLMCDQLPAKLHYHKLDGYDGIYTIHICSNDAYKASLKVDKGVAIFRRAGPHDEIDKNP